MKTLFLLSLGLAGLVVRWSRWLAWLQQKEYRPDRLMVFSLTREGKQEWRRLWPKKSDFSRAGFKRPKLTARILFVVSISIFLFFLWSWLGWKISSPQSPVIGVPILLIWIFLFYIFIPLFIFIASGPTIIVAYLITHYYLHRARKIFKLHHPFVIGITGSYGKTSTKQLLHHVLGGDAQVFATPGSHNTKLSLAKAIVNHYHGQPLAIIEYAAYTEKEIADLTKAIRPNQAIITGLTDQHLGLFGDRQKIIAAKAELIAALPNESAIYYNADDAGSRQIVDFGLKLRDSTNQQISLHPYGQKNALELGLSSAGVSPHGHLEAVINHQIYKFSIIGDHYLSNLLAAVMVAKERSLKPFLAWERLRNFRPGVNFTRRFNLSGGSFLIDDGGSSNPSGFLAIIRVVERLTARQKILVTAGIVDLGCESEKIHAQLAKEAARVFHQVWYLGESGKSEFALEFGSDYLDDQRAILSTLSKLSAASLILAEGKLPLWFTRELEKLKL